MPVPNDPATLVHAVYASLGSGNVPALLALAAAESRWTVNAPKDHPFGGTYLGHKGFQQFLGKVAGSVEIVELKPDEVHSAGNEVFVVGHEAGRWKSSGKSYSTRWIHRFRLKDGKVVLFEEWFDTASAMATMK